MTYEIISAEPEGEKYLLLTVKTTEGEWSGARKRLIDKDADVEAEAKSLAEETIARENGTWKDVVINP